MLVERLKIGRARPGRFEIGSLKGLSFTKEKLPAAARSRLACSIADSPARLAPKEEAPSQKFATLEIGKVIREAQRRVTESAGQLAALSDEAAASYLSDLVLSLQKQVCTIAVVGQMNAGKSTLINALIEDPSLLPSHINPWTTVVTKLHFGVPGEPAAGALFEFFNAEEWDWLSTGGQIRQVTERVIPNFDWSALANFVRTIKDKAEARHGSQFAALLGSKHSYPEIMPGLLAKYVAAGMEKGQGHETSPAGEYADLTKTANVYFDLGPFDFPTIVLDTPGVNDPFLVRDEVTRQSLREADVCVVVVTAKQPLSEADLTLLRLLRGLHKNSLILFVNKFDEVDGGEEVRGEIIKRLKATLDREFPSVYIPIVFGSAHWAYEAISQLNKGEPAALSFEHDAPLCSNGSADRARDSAGLFEQSGFPALALKISEMMQSGAVLDAIAQAGSLVAVASRNAERCIRLELDLMKAMEMAPDDARRRLERMGDTVSAMSQLLIDGEKSLKELCEREAEALRSRLLPVVEDFRAMDNSTPWDSQEGSARDLLERKYMAAWDSALSNLRSAFEGLKSRAETCLADTAPLEIPLPHYASFTPELTPLSAAGTASSEDAIIQSVAGDMEETSRARRIREMKAAGLENIVAMLSEEAKAAFWSLSGAGISGIRVACLSYLRNSLMRMEQLTSPETYSAEGNAVSHELKSGLTQRNAELAILRGISNSLPSDTKTCIKLAGLGGTPARA